MFDPDYDEHFDPEDYIDANDPYDIEYDCYDSYDDYDDPDEAQEWGDYDPDC